MTDIERSIIIKTFANAVRQGKLTIEQVPDEYKEEVSKILNGGN